MSGGCEWHPDDAGYVPLDEALRNLAQPGCALPAEIVGFASPTVIRDKHGHELDGDFDPRGHGGCDHRATPEWKAEHPPPPRKKLQEVKMDTETNTPPAESTPEPAPMLALATNVIPVEASAVSSETTASVGVDSAVAQMKALVPGGADASPALLVGGAAALAVIGAGIKFGPQMLKARAEKQAQEHEAAMKRLEIEQQKAEQQKQQDDQHQSCSASRAALEARVVAAEAKAQTLEARLSEVAAKADKVGEGGGLDLGDFDPEALEKRIAAIEKAVKPAAKAKGKK